MRKTLLIMRAAAAGIAMAAALGAAAQTAGDFPRLPIRIVVGAPAGGGTDLAARIVANALTEQSRWTTIVENKPGATGIIGTDFVAKAKPDGYTLALAQTATFAINPELYKALPYDALKDFVPVALISEQPVVLAVRADSPYKSVADLVAAHKAKPMNMATAGAGTVGHFVGEMFGRLIGMQFTAVPYKGSAPAIQDLIGGQVDCMFVVPSAALPLLQSGRLRALAVSSGKRLPLLPEVPTFEESGFKGFQASEWKALVAPAGTPAQVVAKLNEHVQRALSQPSAIGRMISDGSLPLNGSAADAKRYLQAEFSRWAAAVKSSGLSKTY